MGQPPFTPDDIDAVFFDLDGTLMAPDDASVGFWETRRARARIRREQASPLARLFLTLRESPINAIIKTIDIFGLEGMMVRLIARIPGQANHDLFPPVQDANTLIDRLAARYHLAVVSNRREAEIRSFLTEANVNGKVGVVVGRDSTWRIKPQPQPLRKAAERLGVPIERCLMVGDTTVDMLAARRAGAWAVAVLCGFGKRAELERAGAHLILEHTRDVADLL